MTSEHSVDLIATKPWDATFAALWSMHAASVLVPAAGMTGLTSLSGLPECDLLRCREELSLD
jgi:hypothetical protein